MQTLTYTLNKRSFVGNLSTSSFLYGAINPRKLIRVISEGYVPGGDLGMDISKALLSKLIAGDSPEAVLAAF